MPDRLSYAAMAARIARAHGLPVAIFLSLIRAESGFNPASRSPFGGIGLGQIQPGQAQAMGLNPFDPEQNLEASARIFRQHLDQFHSLPLALAAYHLGPQAVLQAGGVPPAAAGLVQQVQGLAAGYPQGLTSARVPGALARGNAGLGQTANLFLPTALGGAGVELDLNGEEPHAGLSRFSGRSPFPRDLFGRPDIAEEAADTIREPEEEGTSAPDRGRPFPDDLFGRPDDARQAAEAAGRPMTDEEAEAYEQDLTRGRLQDEGDLEAGQFAHDFGVGTGSPASIPDESDFSGEASEDLPPLPGPGDVQKLGRVERFFRRFNR